MRKTPSASGASYHEKDDRLAKTGPGASSAAATPQAPSGVAAGAQAHKASLSGGTLPSSQQSNNKA